MRAKIILLFLLTAQLMSVACSCVGKASVKEAIKESDVVFVGKIISKEEIAVKSPDLSYNIGDVKYLIAVQYCYKGDTIKQMVEIRTGRGHGDCGVMFEIGKEYIVYAKCQKYHFEEEGAPKYLYTNICTRTCEKNNTEIKEIEKYRK